MLGQPRDASYDARRRNLGARYEPLNMIDTLQGEQNFLSKQGPQEARRAISRGLAQVNLHAYDDGDNQAQQERAWEGTCIHIVIELAECGDVQ